MMNDEKITNGKKSSLNTWVWTTTAALKVCFPLVFVFKLFLIKNKPLTSEWTVKTTEQNSMKQCSIAISEWISLDSLYPF